MNIKYNAFLIYLLYYTMYYIDNYNIFHLKNLITKYMPSN